MKQNRIYRYQIILLAYLIPFSVFATEPDWHNAQWIGYTKDHRQKEWSARKVVFNRPPADISSWVPTEKELEAREKTAFPSPFLRKAFDMNKPMESASLAVCGLGLYELYLNGEKVGDRVLDPAQTSYDKRAFYVVHDVTNQIETGENAIGLMLGNGFYGQNIAFNSDLSYGVPMAILVLNVVFEDGTTNTIYSDDSWKAAQSPVVFDNIYLGETWDARLKIPKWSTAGFDDSDWNNVEIMEAATDNLMEQQMEPMRKIRAINPIQVLPADNNAWIIDMGVNMTGWLQISVNEVAGTKIKMRFSEHLMPDKKNIDPASTGIHVTGDTQTDIYICNGEGTETWEPRFTYHGFRYVQISGLSKKTDLKDFTGWLIRTDAEQIGTFECSNPLIQKYYNVSLLTLEDNIQGILTDCPHRERCAWMGDCHAVGEFASYSFDLRKFWRKTAGDIETVLGQQNTHKGDNLPRDPRAPCNISVGKRLCLQARPDWGAATVLVPWFAYLYYNDTILVEQSWDVMEGWMDYLAEFALEDGIIYQGYGDWCPPGSNAKINTPKELTSTALYYRSLIVMAKMAKAIGKSDAAKNYENAAIEINKAFNAKFLIEDYGSQTGNAVALQSGLVPVENEQEIADLLNNRLYNEGGYSTGIFGHRPLYTLLNDFGHDTTTTYLWHKTDWPSLGFLTEKHDLTTWSEVPYNWEPNKRYLRNSFNHPMHSGFAATFFESIGGIRPDSENPGFRHFILKPCFLPDLEWANVTYRSPYGKITSSWKVENDLIVWKIIVPTGTTARVVLNEYSNEEIELNDELIEGKIFDLNSGSSVITINWN